MSTFPFQVFNELKFYRETRGLTQIQLSLITGVSKNSISLYEQGKQLPTIGVAYLIAHALCTSIDSIWYTELEKFVMEDIFDE